LSYLESRSGVDVDELEVGALRRGWCLGSPEYKKAMQTKAGERLRKRALIWRRRLFEKE
jgi:hypothetical protein